MTSSIKAQAIQTALTGDWTTAISLNQSVLKDCPTDIDALNRLAFALSTIGKIKDAKKTYQKVLEIDKNNPIAVKNLKRITDLYKGTRTGKVLSSAKILNNTFLEETGKTKVIELVNSADKKTISSLQMGEVLSLSIKRSKIFVQTENKNYIGMLPEDLGRRIIKFLNGGNIYETYVKSVKNLKVCIFIKETKRAKKFKNQPSFLSFDHPKHHFETGFKKTIERKINDHQDDDEDHLEEPEEEE